MLSAKRRFRFVGICQLQRSIPMSVLRSGHRSDKNKGQTHVMAKWCQVPSNSCQPPMFCRTYVRSRVQMDEVQVSNYQLCITKFFWIFQYLGGKKNRRSFKVRSAFNSRSSLTWSLSHVLAAWVVPMHEHLHHLNMASHDIDESIHVRCRHIIWTYLQPAFISKVCPSVISLTSAPKSTSSLAAAERLGKSIFLSPGQSELLFQKPSTAQPTCEVWKNSAIAFMHRFGCNISCCKPFCCAMLFETIFML